MKFSASKPAAGKFVGFLALLLALACTPLFGQEIPQARVAAAYREAEQFYRISEFFTGRENSGGEVVLRTDPNARGGFYFTVKLPRYPYRTEVPGAIRLEVILPGDVEPTLFEFPLGPHRRRNPLILVGLTGETWPNPRAVPLAWRISFIDSRGRTFAARQSFLWG